MVGKKDSFIVVFLINVVVIQYEWVMHNDELKYTSTKVSTSLVKNSR